jgi:hypothetical protein
MDASTAVAAGLLVPIMGSLAVLSSRRVALEDKNLDVRVASARSLGRERHRSPRAAAPRDRHAT